MVACDPLEAPFNHELSELFLSDGSCFLICFDMFESCLQVSFLERHCAAATCHFRPPFWQAFDTFRSDDFVDFMMLLQALRPWFYAMV